LAARLRWHDASVLGWPLAGEQEKQFAGMLHMSCSHFRRGITPPEQINTTRTGNRASGVMVEDKTG
jgi:hypothetical protein